MNFTSALIWILIIYAIYYTVIILHDSFLKRNLNEVTGVDEITVVKPEEKPIRAKSHQDYMPNPFPEEEADIDEGNGQGSIAEKKKFD